MTLQELQKLFPSATTTTWHQHPNGGGWVENTASVAAAVYVGQSAQVYGSAHVYGSAQVCGSALVGSPTDYICVGPIGSRNDRLTLSCGDKGIVVATSCFVGTVKEFLTKVKDTHGDNIHAKNYADAVGFMVATLKRHGVK